MIRRVIPDTNILVAAGFNPRSHAAGIVRRIRSGTLELVWHQQTKAEYRHIISKIPVLSWPEFEDLFAPEWEHKEPLTPGDFEDIPDPDDRKFAALAAASGAVLISNDQHLLTHRTQSGIRVMKSAEFMREYFNDDDQK